MSGHIRPHGPSRWRIVVYLGKRANGKNHYHWETVHGTKKDAKARAAEVLKQRDNLLDGRTLTVGAWLTEWLRTKKSELGGRTYERYEEIVRLHLSPSLGHHKLRKLTAAMVQASYTDALENGRKQKSGGGLAPITVRHHHAVLRAALRDARRQGLVTEAVADNARPPRGAGKVRKALSLEGVKVFLDGLVQHPDRVAANALLLSLYLGSRRGETLALRWSGVDLDGGTVTISGSLQKLRKQAPTIKTTKTVSGLRTLSIPAEMVSMLRSHRAMLAQMRLRQGPHWQDNDLVFPRDDGSHYDPDGLTKHFTRLAKKHGLDTSLHGLRHTAGTLLLEAVGASDRTVADRLGHSSPAITKALYGHAMRGRDASAADGLAAVVNKAKGE